MQLVRKHVSVNCITIFVGCRIKNKRKLKYKVKLVDKFIFYGYIYVTYYYHLKYMNRFQLLYTVLKNI